LAVIKKGRRTREDVTLIKALYDKLVSCVYANGLQSTWFEIMTGVYLADTIYISIYISTLYISITGVRNVSGLTCNRHGLSTGESSRDRHERCIFWRPFLHRLDYVNDVCLLTELMELLVPVLEALAIEAESLGLEVNWQKTMRQALCNTKDIPLPSQC